MAPIIVLEQWPLIQLQQAAVSDQIMTEVSFVHLNTGQAVHTQQYTSYTTHQCAHTNHMFQVQQCTYVVPFSWLMTIGFPSPPPKVTHQATYLNINGRTS